MKLNVGTVFVLFAIFECAGSRKVVDLTHVYDENVPKYPLSFKDCRWYIKVLHDDQPFPGICLMMILTQGKYWGILEYILMELSVSVSDIFFKKATRNHNLLKENCSLCFIEAVHQF